MSPEDQKKLEENMRNFPLQTSRASEEAKRILFGKDITKMMLDTPVYGVENGEGVEYEFTNENRPKPQSQWNDPEMTGPKWTEEDSKRAIENIEFVKPDFSGIEKLGKIDSDYAKEADKLMHSNPSMDTQNDELAKIAKEMMETHVFPEPWIKAICDYCYQNNITPDQLIAQHQNYKTAVFQTAAKPPKE